MMPTAVNRPKSRMAGIGNVRREANPMAAVSAALKHGRRIRRWACSRAAGRARPCTRAMRYLMENQINPLNDNTRVEGLHKEVDGVQARPGRPKGPSVQTRAR